MTQEEIKAAARACIKGPTARVSESEAAERIARLRRKGQGRPCSTVYRERYSVMATIVDTGRVIDPFDPKL